MRMSPRERIQHGGNFELKKSWGLICTMPPKQPLRYKNVGGRQRRSKVSDTAAPPQLSETLSRRVKPVAGRSAVFAPKKPAPPLPAVTAIPSLPLSLSQTSFHSVPSFFSSESSRNPSPSSPPIIPVGTPSSLQLIQLEDMPPPGLPAAGVSRRPRWRRNSGSATEGTGADDS